MSEFLEFVKDTYKEVTDEIPLSADVGAGLIDTGIGFLLLGEPYNYHHIAATAVEYALGKPAGIAIGFFGILCLKAAVQRTYHRFHTSEL